MPQWMKDLLTKRAKAPILRELDRAIGKAKSGETAAQIVPALRDGLTRALRGWLPAGLGEMLLGLVLADVNWDQLLTLPSDKLAEFLTKLRKRVETMRF